MDSLQEQIAYLDKINKEYAEFSDKYKDNPSVLLYLSGEYLKMLSCIHQKIRATKKEQNLS